MTGQDIASIVNVVNLYPIAVDSLQWSLFDQVFTPDACVDFGGAAVWNDLASLRLAFEAIHAPFTATQHATRGHHVNVDGDHATCLSYVHGRFIREVGEGGNMFESTGWYDDRLLRTDLGWRICRRTCRTVWWGGNPQVLQTAPEVHVEHQLDALSVEVREGRIGHFAALPGVELGAAQPI